MKIHPAEVGGAGGKVGIREEIYCPDRQYWSHTVVKCGTIDGVKMSRRGEAGQNVHTSIYLSPTATTEKVEMGHCRSWKRGDEEEGGGVGEKEGMNQRHSIAVEGRAQRGMQ